MQCFGDFAFMYIKILFNYDYNSEHEKTYLFIYPCATFGVHSKE